MSPSTRERSTETPAHTPLHAALAHHREHLSSCDIDDPAVDHHRRAADLIVAALERLELGTYGICLTCGGAIPSERLEALPEASTCLGCTETAPTLFG